MWEICEGLVQATEKNVWLCGSKAKSLWLNGPIKCTACSTQLEWYSRCCPAHFLTFVFTATRECTTVCFCCLLLAPRLGFDHFFPRKTFKAYLENPGCDASLAGSQHPKQSWTASCKPKAMGTLTISMRRICKLLLRCNRAGRGGRTGAWSNIV